MKKERNILIAFILNLGFSIFEFIGGIITNSVAVISDSVHDMGDALSIGLSCFLENKSRKEPDDKYTYGYVRYSVLGAFITTTILIIGSIFVILNSINRLINPVEINYNGMIIFAFIGTIVNFLAAYFTREGNSLNQKSVNLHMLEDVLGWLIVLIGAIIMRSTNITILDPILSILVALFILKNSFSNFKMIIDLFLEKIPSNISLEEIKKHILEIKGVVDVHHIHIWSIDGYNNYATMHVVIKKNNNDIKKNVRQELKEHGISHVTIELENESEKCDSEDCHILHENINGHHHHH